jgi:hypothetical protein
LRPAASHNTSDDGGRGDVVGRELRDVGTGRAQHAGHVLPTVTYRRAQRRQAPIVGHVRVGARLEQPPNDRDAAAVGDGAVQVRAVAQPRDAKVRIGAVIQVEIDAGRVLEVEHPGQAIRDPPGMRRRAGPAERSR